MLSTSLNRLEENESNVIFLLKTFSNHLTKISDQFLIADIRQLMHMRAFLLTILYFMVSDKSKVILNGMTDSSWSFRPFISLSIKILDSDAETLT